MPFVLIANPPRHQVCDFGLSRGLVENEYNSQMKNVPVRWTAPEGSRRVRGRGGRGDGNY
jgi:hypothetical protein